MKKPAVVLLSGGLDSATCLGLAIDLGFEPIAVSFDYSQRHRIELEAASELVRHYGIQKHFIFDLGAFRSIGGSALTDDRIDVPRGRAESEMSAGIPVTYVPARNLVFLSHALGVAEVNDAQDIFIGVNALDYSGYPDCRPEFIRSFEATANLAIKAGVEGARLKIHSPLVDLTKAEIIRLGTNIGVPYHLTHSCYSPTATGAACGACDSCILRQKGFAAAGLPDPTRYERAA